MVSDSGHSVKRIEPGAFENYLHWYPKALNAAIHPLVHFFLHMENRHIADRYCHLHPAVNEVGLRDLLSYQPSFYRWAGADLINVTNARGKRQMVVIENNSCPSGQKSLPLAVDHKTQGGYRELIEQSFKPFLASSAVLKKGVLAVFYDKNFMETSGYAASMADVFQEPVYLVAVQDKPNPHFRCTGDYIEILTAENEWLPVAAAFRYVTQRPWNRIPATTSTKIYNPVITCLAGGRNKLMAARAYEDFNKECKEDGLKIRIPETIQNVRKEDVPVWIKHFGGQAVVKIPYSNAGQGVYTIVNDRELKAFMRMTTPYDKLIVQSLIGNYRWSSKSMEGRFYHLGTMPDHRGESFVFDLRMMVCATPTGFRPISLYSRRADQPLPDRLTKHDDSWAILGTNLSRLVGENEWTTDTSRLLLMDRRDFNTLGLGLDDLIEAYVQSIMSTVAIDKLAVRLTNSRGGFRRKLFASMNPDKALLSEIMK